MRRALAATVAGLALAAAFPSAGRASAVVPSVDVQPVGDPALSSQPAVLLPDVPAQLLSQPTPLDGWRLAQADPPPAPEPAPAFGPPAPEGTPPPEVRSDRYDSFFGRVGAVKWELLASLAFLTAVDLPRDIRHGHSFRFQDEGWFGNNTDNLGVDKTAHAFNDYLFSEIMYQRMRRKTGDTVAAAATSAALGFGIQLYGELFDGFESDGGWSWQDVAFDALGSGISFVRNVVPGLKDKLDFRILIMPDHDVYTFQGKAHFEQQRFLLALKLSGFEAFKRGPLRFVELHAGYYASGFTLDQRAEGVPLRRRPFVGIGINLKELFFPHPTGWLSKAANTVLDYVQVPYTAASIDVHGHVSD